MLISFTVENYRSFAEAQTLSLVAGREPTHKKCLIDCSRFSLLRAAGVFGANASGKSNLVKAFQFVKSLVSTSATRLTLGDPIADAKPFRLASEFAEKPCRFEVRVLLSGKEYQYGFSASTARVYDEWLYVRRPGSRLANPLLRRFDPESQRPEWKLRGGLAGTGDVVAKTRDNGLFLSRAAEMNVKFVEDLFLWFRNGLGCFDLSGGAFIGFPETAKQIADDPEFHKRVEGLVHDADLGIEGLASERHAVELPKRVPKRLRPLMLNLKGMLRNIQDVARDLDVPEAGSFRELFTSYTVRTFHKGAGQNNLLEFSLRDESAGTQRFFGLLGPVLNALDEARVLVVDELDCSMHPLLTEKIVKLFQSPDSNPKGAQLIFATHDTSLMKQSLLRRDQIWLTEKNSKGATELFSLADLEGGKKPRKQEALEKNYLAGRYGGVPIFGPTLEDLEVP